MPKIAHMFLPLLLASATLTADNNQPPKKRYDRISIEGHIDEDLARKLAGALREIGESDSQLITIELNSTGGFVMDGFLIAKAIESTKIPVYCIIDGQALSMAFYILQSCPFRFVTKRSLLMLHNPQLPDPMGGDMEHFQNYVNQLRVLGLAMSEHYATRLRLPLDTIRQRMAQRDYWMTPLEALEIGAIDMIVPTADDAYLLILSAEAAKSATKETPKEQPKIQEHKNIKK